MNQKKKAAFLGEVEELPKKHADFNHQADGKRIKELSADGSVVEFCEACGSYAVMDPAGARIIALGLSGEIKEDFSQEYIHTQGCPDCDSPSNKREIRRIPE